MYRESIDYFFDNMLKETKYAKVKYSSNLIRKK